MKNDYFLDFFEDGMKICAICSDLDICDEQMRLLIFIHIKLTQFGQKYFEQDHKNEIIALRTVLGDTRYIEELYKEENLNEKTIENVTKVLDTYKNTLKNLDVEIKNNYGLENRLTNELRYRLLLYSNKKFMTEIVNLYEKEIKYRIKIYDNKKVDEAFENYRKKIKKQDEDLLKMLEL
jgi:hypothetical protein